jgi:uncharacterized membrane protein HdeD (DUF308 family)
LLISIQKEMRVMALGMGTPHAEHVRGKWGWFLALGILMLIFGIVAFLNLFLATVASVFYIGAMMFVGGAFQLVHSFQVKGWSEAIYWGLSGLLYTIAGILAFWNPALTAVILTLFMAVALVIAGAVRTWVGFRMRPMRGSGWVIFGGIVTIIAGVIIAIGWPVNSLWILGLFLAVDLTLQGWAMIAVAMAARG